MGSLPFGIRMALLEPKMVPVPPMIVTGLSFEAEAGSTMVPAGASTSIILSNSPTVKVPGKMMIRGL